MIQASSAIAYEEILRRLPECAKPVYRMIFENPGIAIGEIGEALRMQNSTVSGRVNDLIDDSLVHYVVNDAGELVHKISSISGKQVLQLRVNDIFKVDVNQIKQREKKAAQDFHSPTKALSQGNLFPVANDY